jgi:hypothetical protein
MPVQRTVFHKLSEALCRDWSEAGEGLQLLHSADASQLQVGLKHASQL